MAILKEEDFIELSNLINNELKKANKKEVSKVKHKLSIAIESDIDGMPIVLKHMQIFPPDIISEAILKVWNNIEDVSRNNIISYIFTKTGNNIEMRLFFLSKYCKQDAALALILFSDFYNDYSKHLEKSDNVAFLRLIRNTLLDSNSLFLSKTASKVNALDVSALTPVISIICRAAFTNSKKDKLYFNANLQKDVLIWIASAGSATKLSDDLVEAIIVNMAKWPVAMLADIEKFLPRINESLKTQILNKLPSLNIYCHPKNESNLATAKESFQGVEKENRQDEKGAINPKEALQQVIQYINGLEQKIINIEKDYWKKLDKSELRKNELVEKLNVEHGKVNQVNTSLCELSGINNELQNKHDKLAHEYKEMVEKHATELHKLTDKIDSECNYQLGVFRNRIAEKFRIDFNELKNIEEKTMSEKLGENLRIQLRQLFAKLKQEGINFDN